MEPCVMVPTRLNTEHAHQKPALDVIQSNLNLLTLYDLAVALNCISETCCSNGNVLCFRFSLIILINVLKKRGSLPLLLNKPMGLYINVTSLPSIWELRSIGMLVIMSVALVFWALLRNGS